MKKLDHESGFAKHFFDISIDYLGLWDTAVMQQLERLRKPTSSMGHTVDFVILVISLHNLELALRRYRDELWHGIGSGEGSKQRRRCAKLADQALEIFENQVPHIRDMRNIFSHFEEYAFGVGRLQESGVPLIVRSSSDNIMVVVKDPSLQFELDMSTIKLVLGEVRAYLMEIFTYYDPVTPEQ